MKGWLILSVLAALSSACAPPAGSPDSATPEPADAATKPRDASALTDPVPADVGLETYQLEIPLSPEVQAAGGEVSVIRLPNEGDLVHERLSVSPGTQVLSVTATNAESLAMTQSAAAGAATSVSVAQPGCGAPSYPTGARLQVPGDFATIQAAVDAARPGDTVEVGPGVWTENLRMRPGVRLRGSGAGRTMLDGQGRPRNLVDLTAAPGVVISGFTFRGVGRADSGCAAPDDPLACSGDWYAAAIYGDGHWVWYESYAAGHPGLDAEANAPLCSGAFAFISNNVFEQNFIAVLPYFWTRLVLSNNVFRDNTFAFAGNHLNCRGALVNNVFWGTREIAVAISGGYVDVVDNVIAASGTGFYQEFVQQGRIACNLFWRNETLEATRHPGQERIVLGAWGNAEADPRFADAANGDFHLAPDSPAIDSGCQDFSRPDGDGSPADLGAYGGPLGASW